MANEVIQPKPLSGEEVQNAVVYKIIESFERDCHLHAGNAYSAFSAEITIKLKLNDMGRIQPDNHAVKAESENYVHVTEIGSLDVNEINHTFNIEPAPPNQVRMETGQEVPVRTVIDGKVQEKRVKYAPRKKK